jgi:integrase
VKYPVKVKHRGHVRAVIYNKAGAYGMYRVSWHPVEGQRRMKAFERYSAAKRFADELVKELAKGSQTTLLTAQQAADAITAFQTLDGFYQKTGKRLSIAVAVSQLCDAAVKLGDRPVSVSEAVGGFLSTIATIKRMDLLKAVEDWNAMRQPKTVAKKDKRPQLSPGYHYNVSMWAKEFANTFPGHAVCDLSKEHIDQYFKDHSDVGPKSRNERRGVIRMFLTWAAKQDYISATHRLLEADSMAREIAEPEDIALYTSGELQAMLERASRAPKAVKEGEEPEPAYRHLVPLIALVGLGGIRLQEAARMTWEDVWHVEGHLEVPAGKSKTRSRRLSTMCESLRQWLEPNRDTLGPLWAHCMDYFHREFERMLAELKTPIRRNGLRHGFVSAHYALYSDEGLTAKESGNSPAMVHKHYKGLMTAKQGAAWFAVVPEQPANVIQLSKTKVN